MSHTHKPVMLEEAMDALNLGPGLFVDATFGRGGYTQTMLKHKGVHVIAIDQDPEAICWGTQHFGPDIEAGRLVLHQIRFSHMESILPQDKEVRGVVFDLGVSSPQLDNAERGFSFLHDGPLDMRMDQNGPTAADFVNTAPAQDIARVLKVFGEEKLARRIARAIEKQRNEKPFTRTRELASFIEALYPPQQKTKGKIHPATRTFQAIRIHLNQEIRELEEGLQKAAQALVVGGRLVVISFHSLEDRVVKHVLRPECYETVSPYLPPRERAPGEVCFQGPKRVLKPSMDECRDNPRSRSARLRWGERIL
jgi:16S rRNA (cytosine1402-N4)-methyltransferase